MAFENGFPGSVAKLGGDPGRIDDVGEQDRGERLDPTPPHEGSFYLRQESGKQTRTDPGVFPTPSRGPLPRGRRQRTYTERIEDGATP